MFLSSWQYSSSIILTSSWPAEWGLLALAAETLRETLRQHAQEGIGEVERIHAHVEQADDRLGCAVRVERREHQVTGERGFDADRSGLLVAHLTHHDDVGIGAQERPHGGREVETRLHVHLHLAQPLLA